GCIYQICRAFRADERGRRHNPEFTLIEWYRVGFDHWQLMEETAALAALALGPRPVETLTYREAFLRFAGIDPFRASVAELIACARGHDIPLPPLSGDARDPWLDLLLSEVVTPMLGRGVFTFLCDFPASQAALARLRREADGIEVAERFELFIDGMEIANGYHELTDPAEQRQRFERERARRLANGEPPSSVDDRLLAALAAGMPDCAGVALGFDRLVMLAVGAERIDEGMAFPIGRCAAGSTTVRAGGLLRPAFQVGVQLHDFGVAACRVAAERLAHAHLLVGLQFGQPVHLVRAEQHDDGRAHVEAAHLVAALE